MRLLASLCLIAALASPLLANNWPNWRGPDYNGVADGKVYVTREDGKTFVLAQGNEFKVLAANDLDGTQTVATPVFTDGKILIRTDTHLYCIGL